MDWGKFLAIVNSLSGPLITAVAVFAAILFYRSDRRLCSLSLLIGAVMIFLLRSIHAFVRLPGLGYFDRAEQLQTHQIIAFNNFTVVFNLIGWLFFVFGLLILAKTRIKTSGLTA